MIGIAFATPLLALMLVLAARAGRITMPPKSRIVILLMAGPLNLVLWVVFQRYLDGVGNRSVYGIILAVVVFIAVGFGAGFLRGRGSEDRRHPQGSDES